MSEVGAATRALLAMVGDGGDGGPLAERICLACVEGLKVDGAAISLLTTTVSRETLWATDETAELLEDLQFTLNEGPCIEAASTGAPVLVSDLHHSSETARWPVFAASVAEQTDIRGLFALPFQWGTVNLGVLDLYRTVPCGLGDRQRDAIDAADTAALMILSERTDPDGILGADGGLGRQLNGRAEIHQATGMVLAQLEASPKDALARMRAYAFTEQRLLIDVARDVIARRLTFAGDRY